MSESKIENVKNDKIISVKKYMLVCYLDIDDIPHRLDMIPNLKNYAYILHDKDFNINGEMEKPHIHVYISLTKRVQLNVIASKFNIADNLVEVVQNELGCLRYLVHRNYKNKYQYNPDEVYTDIVDYKYILDEFRQNEYFFNTIIDLIEQNNKLKDIVRWSISNNYYNLLKSNQYLIVQLIKEHYDYIKGIS